MNLLSRAEELLKLDKVYSVETLVHNSQTILGLSTGIRFQSSSLEIHEVTGYSDSA